MVLSTILRLIYPDTTNQKMTVQMREPEQEHNQPEPVCSSKSHATESFITSAKRRPKRTELDPQDCQDDGQDLHPAKRRRAAEASVQEETSQQGVNQQVQQQQQPREEQDTSRTVLSVFSLLFPKKIQETSSASAAPGTVALALQYGHHAAAEPPAGCPQETLVSDSCKQLEPSQTQPEPGPTPAVDLPEHSATVAQQQLAVAGQQLDTSDEEYEEVEDDEYIDFDPLLFIKTLPPLESCTPAHRTTILPRKTRQCKQKTLVLDLDETLVHSSLEAISDAHFSFPVTFNNQEHMVHVRKRPHLAAFIERVSELFEVVVFTASQKIYAERLLNIIDPKRQYIKHRIYRDSCVMVDGNYLKDLTVLGRDLRHTVIIDNSPQAFGFQVDNGIPIESWYEDESDQELIRLLPFLESLVDVDDVRPHIQRKFRLRELIERAF